MNVRELREIIDSLRVATAMVAKLSKECPDLPGLPTVARRLRRDLNRLQRWADEEIQEASDQRE